MTMRQKQKGMTMWGVATVFALIVFFALLTLKLLPPYLENIRVKTVLNNLAAESSAATLTPEDMAVSLERRFDIEDISRVDPHKDVKLEIKGNKKIIRAVYEVRVPLAYNISAVLDFDDHVEVARVE